MAHGIQQKRLKIVRGSPHRQRLEGCFALVEKMKRKEWRDAPLSSCRAKSVFKQRLVRDSVCIVFVSVTIGSQHEVNQIN